MGKFLKINFLLFITASAIAGYLIHTHYMVASGNPEFHSFCSISSLLNCDAVNSSKFAEFLGMPLAVWALGYYLLGALLSLVALWKPYLRREAFSLLLPLSGMSVIVALGLTGVMATQLKTYCLLCLATHGIDILTFIFTCLAWRAAHFQESFFKEFKKSKHTSLIGFSLLGAAFIGTAHFISFQLAPKLPPESEYFLSLFRAQPVVDANPGNAPRLGFKGSNPPVIVVEFADFQCPACKFAAQRMRHLLATYGDKIQLAFRNYPLDPSCNPNVPVKVHDQSCAAARAVYCAHKQGKFEAYYERLFEHQSEISDQNMQTWAADLGLDTQAFNACRNSAEANEAVQADIAEGTRLGVGSTPVFFFNGKKVEGGVDEKRLRLILRELGKL